MIDGSRRRAFCPYLWVWWPRLLSVGEDKSESLLDGPTPDQHGCKLQAAKGHIPFHC